MANFSINMGPPTNRKISDCVNDPLGFATIKFGSAEWYALAMAYQQAGDRLVKFSQDNPRITEPTGAPMMFLFRHSIELHLKSLLLDAGELFDVAEDVTRNHGILDLWERVRKYLAKTGNTPLIARAAAVVKELDLLDKGSYTFRYPVDNNGTPMMAQSLTIDPQNVSDVIGELQSLLRQASQVVAQLQEGKDGSNMMDY